MIENASCIMLNFAIATGTPEVSGWSTRELIGILDGLEGLEVIGADVGELLLIFCLDLSPN